MNILEQIPPAATGAVCETRSALGAIPGEEGLVSAIVPTFNRAHLVVDALDCLASQTYEQIQIIVVDDGSTDDTQLVLREWRARNPNVDLDVAYQANAGVSAARNRGLELARGEFIFFLDSDDLNAPDAVARLAHALGAHPEAPFVVAHIRNTDLVGNTIPFGPSGRAKMSGETLFNNHWMTNSALYRRRALCRSGPFRNALRNGEDTELIWRLVATNGLGIVLDRTIGTRRHHASGHLSLNRSLQDQIRRGIGAYHAFAGWIEAEGRHGQYLSAWRLVGIVGLGIRAGAMGDMVAKTVASRIPGRLSPQTPVVNALAAIVGRPNARWYYRAVFAGYISLKFAKDGVLYLTGLLGSPRQANDTPAASERARTAIADS